MHLAHFVQGDDSGYAFELAGIIAGKRNHAEVSLDLLCNFFNQRRLSDARRPDKTRCQIHAFTHVLEQDLASRRILDGSFLEAREGEVDLCHKLGHVPYELRGMLRYR